MSDGPNILIIRSFKVQVTGIDVFTRESVIGNHETEVEQKKKYRTEEINSQPVFVGCQSLSESVLGTRDTVIGKPDQPRPHGAHSLTGKEHSYATTVVI